LESFDFIIVGAGAAGLFAAAHSKGKTIVLEKKSSPGNKLLIAGQGRCNFTHSGPVTGFFSHYGKNETFIKHALKNYSNKDLIAFFKENGLSIFEDKNGKLFPESGNAKDILDILLHRIKKNGHSLRLNEPVSSLSFKDGLFYAQTKNKSFSCKKLLIATGGRSYPTTGSAGDGYAFAKELGHSLVEPKPALSPATIKNYAFAEISGNSLKDCEISLYRGGKKMAVHSGDVGFTHKGLSGPGILDFSRYFENMDILKLNICGISANSFNDRFLDEVKDNGKNTIQSFLRQFDLPKALLRLLLAQTGIDPAEKIGNINKNKRREITEKFCECAFEIERTGGFNVAMCTAGGVNLDEINPKTMESRIRPGLFFAGEVLDIDGDTGGYNLQAAFSTGYMAAVNEPSVED